MPTKAISDYDRFIAWAATAPTDEVRSAISAAAAIVRRRTPQRKKATKPNSQDLRRSEQVIERDGAAQ